MLYSLLLLVSGFVGGIIIAVAGGGTFVTFPVLLLVGVPAVNANASSTVALFPGNISSAWAYRRDVLGISEINVKIFTAISLVGSLIGAVLLLVTPSTFFSAFVPWLMLFATTVFAIGNFAPLSMLERVRLGTRSMHIILFVISVYGGYFGGGMGFLMLATFTLFGMRDIYAMNGLKLVLALVMTITAVLAFIVAGAVYWAETAPILVGSLLGGHFGAQGAKRIDQRILKLFIVTLGAVITVYFFWHGA